MSTLSEQTYTNTVASSVAKPHSNSTSNRVIEEAANVLSSVQLVVANTFDLLALETRKASLNLTWMFALALVTAILALTAWFGLMTVLALGAVAWGMSWISTILLMVIVNVSAALGMVFMSLKVSQNLLFCASRRQYAMKLLAQSSPI